MRGRRVQKCTVGRERRRNTAAPRRAMLERQPACRSEARRRCAQPFQNRDSSAGQRSRPVALIAFENRMPARYVDPQLGFRIVGAVTGSSDRLDSLRPGMDSHQRVGHRDGGAAVGHGDGEEIGQRAGPTGPSDRCRCRRCWPPPLRGTGRSARAPPHAEIRSARSATPIPSSWANPAQRSRSRRAVSTPSWCLPLLSPNTTPP